MGYEWLPAGLQALRGIEPHDVVPLLTSTTRWPRPAQGPDGHWVLTIWGRAGNGQPLIVATRQLSQWDWQIIGARRMTTREITEFEAWEARDEQ